MEPLFDSFDSLFDKPQENIQPSHSPPAQESIEYSQSPICFSPPPNLSRLKPLSSCKKNIVLLLYGSFYPIHNNHLRALQITQEHIQTSPELSKMYHVLGSFILPTHINSLRKKLGRPLLPNDVRLALCETAIQSLEFTSLLPFLSLQKTNIGIHKAKKFLTDYLNFSLMKGKKKNQKIAVVSVLGDDNLDIVEKSLAKRELIVIVQNRPNQTKKDLMDLLNSEKITPYKENLIVIVDEKVPYETRSSEIRKWLSSSDAKEREKSQTFLPPQTYQYLASQNIVFPIPETLTAAIKPQEKLVTISACSIEELVGYKVPVQIPFSSLISSPIARKLGEGLQAEVLSMIWNKSPNERIPVAVKITDLSVDRGRKLKAFSRDLRALLLCDHNNVVRCYGAGFEGNKLFAVMERGLGLNTWNFMQEQRKTWENKSRMPTKWFKYLAELAEGLNHMSEKGILHRDLQMNNIVVFSRNEFQKKLNSEFEEMKNGENEDNSVPDYKISEFQFKICDFGVSALESDKNSIVRGSMRHYAPEAIADKNNYVSASDVYSFGNLLYEIVNARKTFTEYTVEILLKKVQMGERPNFMKNCDLRLKEVIESCWQHDWRVRPDFKEVALELHRIYDENKDKN